MIPNVAEQAEEILDEVDIEEYAKSDRKPPKARRYRIRIDKTHYVVEVSSMTGRELLKLAGKDPVRFAISQKLRGGQMKRIGLDEVVDFTSPGVERFVTMPLDQTEGCR